MILFYWPDGFYYIFVLLSLFNTLVFSRLEEESSAFYSSARLWDDGVILPQNTRKVGFFLIVHFILASQKDLVVNA